MQDSRAQITESQKVRSDLMKWKLVLISSVGTVGLGLGSIKFPKAHLLSCLIPFISVYVDSLCAHLSLRIKAIGVFWLTITPQNRAEEIIRSYEKFLRDRPPYFRLETIALHWSTVFISILVVAYGFVYCNADTVILPLIGNFTTSILFYISGGIGCVLTFGIQLFFNHRSRDLKKSAQSPYEINQEDLHNTPISSFNSEVE